MRRSIPRSEAAPATRLRSSRRRLRAAIEALAESFGRRFPPTLGALRRIGREAEFPLVWPDGRAGDAALLWEPLLGEGGGRIAYDDPTGRRLTVRVDLGQVGYEIEMGRATVEVVLPPVEDLHQLDALSATAVGRLVRAAAARGMVVLGYGIQPRTPGSVTLMTPKARYVALHRAIGRPWLHFTTTASDQLQVDIARFELVDVINTLNLLSGPIIALTANSSVYAGRVGRYASGREGLLAALGAHRHGMTPRPYATLEEFLTFICGQTCYVLRDSTGFAPYGRPFTSYLATHGPDLDAYLWHEHYTWNSARPRAHHATIEIRPACQQPPDEGLAAAALSLGLVEAWPRAWAFVCDRLGPDVWPAMEAYREDAVRRGLRAREPVLGLLAGLVDLCEDALRRRGRGEEEFLRPIRRRLEARLLPADRAVRLFRSGGLRALIEGLRF
ncbi:MAG: glutamate-cysteine ligase family protein [Armatimonadota bacterium]|nr:glutamate-cysteine ligase family protein [Armatimonadota bacterium]